MWYLRGMRNGKKNQKGREFSGPMHRWENNIKIDIIEIRYGVLYWIEPSQDRVFVNTVLNLQVS